MGFFAVLEGLDGSGGETQTKHLVQYLENKGKDILVLEYPNPDSPMGKLIYDYLNRKQDFSADVQMSLYATDMALDRGKIQETLENGGIVIANRYFLSTLAYQCGAKGVPLDIALDFASILSLPKPDLVIYLDITPGTSIQRKKGENGKLDRHEENRVFLEKVRGSYKELAKDDVFAGKWITLNGEKSITEVSYDIQDIVNEYM